MRKIISILLILIISITSVAFAIEVTATEDTPEVLELSGDALDDILENPESLLDSSVSNQDNDEDVVIKEDSKEDKEDLSTNQEIATDLKVNLDYENQGFTTPTFKIIVLSVAVILIILLLLALSRKKDTMYMVDKSHELGGTREGSFKKKEDSETETDSLPEEDVVIIPALDMEEPDIIIEENIDSEVDLILDTIEFEDESESDLEIADNILEDIEIDLEPVNEITDFDDFDDFDDIDDIDQLSKAIQEKEEELKKLEEEVNTIEGEPIEIEVKEEPKKAKETKTSKPVKPAKETKEVKTTKPAKETKATKPVKEVKETKTTKPVKEVKETKEVKKEEKKETTGLAEDFLKNMEKSMKEDKNK